MLVEELIELLAEADQNAPVSFRDVDTDGECEIEGVFEESEIMHIPDESCIGRSTKVWIVGK